MKPIHRREPELQVAARAVSVEIFAERQQHLLNGEIRSATSFFENLAPSSPAYSVSHADCI
jgi:hypothetical protein